MPKLLLLTVMTAALLAAVAMHTPRARRPRRCCRQASKSQAARRPLSNEPAWLAHTGAFAARARAAHGGKSANAGSSRRGSRHTLTCLLLRLNGRRGRLPLQRLACRATCVPAGASAGCRNGALWGRLLVGRQRFIGKGTQLPHALFDPVCWQPHQVRYGVMDRTQRRGRKSAVVGSFDQRAAGKIDQLNPLILCR
jgi:hypothetical protein